MRLWHRSAVVAIGLATALAGPASATIVSALPATCKAGLNADFVFRPDVPPTLWLCTAANTWTQVSGNGASVVYAGNSDGASVAALASNDYPLMGSQAAVAAGALTAGARSIVPADGVVQALYVQAGGVLGGVGSAITVYKNGVATALTVAIGAVADHGHDTTHQFSVTAGDDLHVRVTVGAGAASTPYEWALVIAVNGGSGGSVTAHNLLSVTHPDTAASSPLAGGMLYADATPAWAQLAGNTTATKKFLSMTSAAPSWVTIAAADLPTITLTGNVTGAASGGSISTTIGANVVTDAMLRQSAALSVIGRSANSIGNVADISGSNNTALRISGSVLGFGAIDISTAQVTGNLPLANGGTSASLTPSNGGVFYSTASAGAILAGTATANKVLMSAATAAPSWSIPTFPNASATSGKTIRSDGTNWIASTATLSDTPGTAGKVLVSDGTNWIASTPTFPNASATAGKFIRSDGTNWLASTSTIPDTFTKGDFLAATTNALTAVPVGTDGQVITADAASTPGVKWAAAGKTAAWTGCTNSAAVTVNTTSYWAAGGCGTGATTTQQTTDTTAATRSAIAKPATLKNLYVVRGAAAGSGKTDTYTLFKNGSTTGILCTIAGVSAVSCNDTTHTAAVVAGDELTLQIITVTGETAAKDTWGFETEFTAGGAGAHNLLSATHTDTNPCSAARGKLLYGSSTPLWDCLAIGAANTYLKSDGTDPSWGANIDVAGYVRAQSQTLPPSGTGTEIMYNAGGVQGEIRVYDRTGAAYKPLIFNDTVLIAAASGNTSGVGTLSIRQGAAASTFGKVGSVAVAFDSASTGNTAGVETDIRTTTLAASVLGTNGDSVGFIAGGSIAATAAVNKRIIVYFGGTAIFDSGALAITTATTWRLTADCFRDSATSVKCVSTLSSSAAGLTAVSQYTAVTGLTLSNTQIYKVTGNGTNASDVKAEVWKVQWCSAL